MVSSKNQNAALTFSRHERERLPDAIVWSLSELIVDPELVEEILGVYRDGFQNEGVRVFFVSWEALNEWIPFIFLARFGSAFGMLVERFALSQWGAQPGFPWISE
ncbi:hypothetical protein [Methylocaldum szegediense]|uniref:Uncharacterized protein n=1 Tax=Methylocaldum szegediense TaxID=73780 RepID=A0ABM9I171_9GAMM|nr:hypothetical protein [Methylocaldum szegediense]CAI8822291.1 protein of unknown function [Methylocaldum szegediense]